MPLETLVSESNTSWESAAHNSNGSVNSTTSSGLLQKYHSWFDPSEKAKRRAIRKEIRSGIKETLINDYGYHPRVANRLAALTIRASKKDPRKTLSGKLTGIAAGLLPSPLAIAPYELTDVLCEGMGVDARQVRRASVLGESGGVLLQGGGLVALLGAFGVGLPPEDVAIIGGSYVALRTTLHFWKDIYLPTLGYMTPLAPVLHGYHHWRKSRVQSNAVASSSSPAMSAEYASTVSPSASLVA